MNSAGESVVFVTGGSRGLGAAISRTLGVPGTTVVINHVERDDAASAVARDVEDAGGRAAVLRADVCDRQALDLAWATLQAQTGIGDVTALVHSAGARLKPTPFLDSDWDLFARHLDVGVRGAYNTCQMFLPGMVARKSGAVVLLASAAAAGVPPSQWSPYVTAKAAMVGLMRALAVEYGPHGIRVNAVSPGLVATELTDFIPDRSKQMAAMQNPLRRLATVDDVAQAVRYLISPGASCLTGVVVPVAGGSVMP